MLMIMDASADVWSSSVSTPGRSGIELYASNRESTSAAKIRGGAFDLSELPRGPNDQPQHDGHQRRGDEERAEGEAWL